MASTRRAARGFARWVAAPRVDAVERVGSNRIGASRAVADVAHHGIHLLREPRVRLDGGTIEGVPQASAKDQAKPAGRAVALFHHHGHHLDFLLVAILSFEPTVCKHRRHHTKSDRGG